MSDIAAAQRAQIERALDGTGTTNLRRATVTDVSPFTISMNGVSIASPPRSPRYGPVVGDTVLVLMDGAAPYVLEAIDRASAPVYAKRTNIFGGPSASTTSFDTSLPTFVSPVTGWVEVSLTLWLYSTASVHLGLTIYDNSSNAQEYGYPGFPSVAVQTPNLPLTGVASGIHVVIPATSWQPMQSHFITYPTVAERTQAPIMRLSSNSNTQLYWNGMVVEKVYAD